MNGRLFANLQIRTASFYRNECIHKKFDFLKSLKRLQGRAAIIENHTLFFNNELSSEVSKKCGFYEVGVEVDEISCLTDENKTQCRVKNSTVIDKANVTISDGRQDSVTDIEFEKNTKVEFLPILVHFKFSNVRTYRADHCSIRSITNRNFEHLTKLQNLSLANNQIEMIQRQTFEGLVRLTMIRLSNYFDLLKKEDGISTSYSKIIWEK